LIESIDGGSNWTVSKELDTLITSIEAGTGIVVCPLVIYSNNSTSLCTIYTTDGTNWSDINTLLKYNNQQTLLIPIIYYTQENGIFILNVIGVTVTGVERYEFTSTDGINWNKNVLNSNIYQMAYNNDIDKYLGNDNLGNIFFGTVSLPICFVENTPVSIDGAIIPIQHIKAGKHTIRGKPIVAITNTVTPDKELICFDPHSLAINCPTQKTVMTQHHLVNHRGKMIKAKDFVGRIQGVYTVPYDGNTLYNVLMNSHETMNVNGMTVETLDPSNEFAKSIINATNY
jgi:hypothetical protein